MVYVFVSDYAELKLKVINNTKANIIEQNKLIKIEQRVFSSTKPIKKELFKYKHNLCTISKRLIIRY